MKPRILLIGSGALTIQQARSFGAEVVLFQDSKRITSDQIEAADEVFLFDATDTDYALALAQVVHERSPLQAVASFNELGLEPAARIRDELRLKGNPLRPVLLTRDKVKMRNLLTSEEGLSLPFSEVRSFEDLEAFFDSMNRPIVVKPSRGTASKGVFLVEDRSALSAAWIHSARAEHFPLIAELFTEGAEYSAESLTLEGKHHLVAITAKTTTGAPYFVETGHTVPASLSVSKRNQIEQFLSRFLTLIGHEVGPAHTEFRLTPHGPVLIESHTRIGGDMISDLVQLATGVDMVYETLRALLSAPVPFHIEGNRGACIQFLCVPEGEVQTIEGLQAAVEAPGVEKAHLFITPGTIVSPCRDSHGRAAYVIASAASATAAEECAQKALANIQVTVQPKKEEFLYAS